MASPKHLSSLLHAAERWLAVDPDPHSRAELSRLLARDAFEELNQRFAGRLGFGTAGLRGLMGAGPGRMNRLVVRQTTLGLARYLETPPGRPAKVVVGFDGRHRSREFAEDTAGVLAARGIHVVLGDRPLATPLCAYATRVLAADAGIVVTASHNPPAYNGYKVFWSNGAQIIPPHDRGIAAAIDSVAEESLRPHSPLPIEVMSIAQAHNDGLVTNFGGFDDSATNATETAMSTPARQDEHGPPRDARECGTAYLRDILRLAPGAAAHPGRARFNIAYTPLHGVGWPLVKETLRRAGFPAVHVVAAQQEPDGAFPTVEFPNPEEPGAMDLVLDMARATAADLILANDPDADRLAVGVPATEAATGYRQLTGNEVGVLLADHLLSQWQAGPATKKRAAVGTSIVSSRLLGRMAQAYDAEYFETLTGFKWLANKAIELDGTPDTTFLFAYEEALGYCVGSAVRDKDGVSAALVFAHLAETLRASGSSVSERLQRLYAAHGLFLTEQISTAMTASAMTAMTNSLRAQAPSHIGGQRVVEARDLLRPSASGLPPTDALIYHTEDDSRVIVRPSGTEAKLKCYYEVVGPVSNNKEFTATETALGEKLRRLSAHHQGQIAAAARG